MSRNVDYYQSTQCNIVEERRHYVTYYMGNGYTSCVITSIYKLPMKCGELPECTVHSTNFQMQQNKGTQKSAGYVARIYYN